MNYDLCSGTCLKKSGIYSVAMFQNVPRKLDVSGVFPLYQELFSFNWTFCGTTELSEHFALSGIYPPSPVVNSMGITIET